MGLKLRDDGNNGLHHGLMIGIRKRALSLTGLGLLVVDLVDGIRPIT